MNNTLKLEVLVTVGVFRPLCSLTLHAIAYTRLLPTKPISISNAVCWGVPYGMDLLSSRRHINERNRPSPGKRSSVRKPIRRSKTLDRKNYVVKNHTHVYEHKTRTL